MCILQIQAIVVLFVLQMKEEEKIKICIIRNRIITLKLRITRQIVKNLRFKSCTLLVSLYILQNYLEESTLIIF